MPRTILTVDDSATMRKMVSFVFKGLGHTVMEADDGDVGLNLVKQHSFDLIISDVNMPRLDGIEFTRQVRQIPGCSSVPILLLTTESDPAKKSLGKAAGATGWIVKPFTADQLKAVYAKLFPHG
jgi:two-component system, chemotaxis family, chemotaxis protein CheY